MIHGIGTDIVAVARLRGMWERHGERALDKLLAPQERAEFALAADKGRFLAKRFAAKEAVLKALGVGLGAAPLRCIEVVRASSGQPSVALHGQADELALMAQSMDPDGLGSDMASLPDFGGSLGPNPFAGGTNPFGGKADLSSLLGKGKK